MTEPRDAANLGKILEKAGVDHLRASLSGRLEPACFTISPEALSAVRAAAKVAGCSQGQLVSQGVALAVEILCQQEGAAFQEVFKKRQRELAEGLKALPETDLPET